MEVVRIVNGHEYTFVVMPNWMVAEEIKGNYDGYKIEQETSCYKSVLYKINTGAFKTKERKNIGTLICNPETEQITLYKFVNDEEHRFKSGQMYGINNEIIKHLRTYDRILIENKTNYFEISVAKAMKVGQYLHFDKYELQLFIPISEFKTKEKSKKTKKKENKNKK